MLRRQDMALDFAEQLPRKIERRELLHRQVRADRLVVLARRIVNGIVEQDSELDRSSIRNAAVSFQQE